MKRRILAAALSAALILSLAACGGKSGSSSSNPGGSSADVSQPEVSGGAASSSTDGSDSSVDSSDSSADVSQPDGSGADTSEPTPPAVETKVTLTLNKTNVTLNKAGATFKLNCKTDPEIDATPTYTSSDTKIATVDKNGTIKAVAPGKATVTVECGGATATASVTCNWKEETSKPETSKPADTKPSGGDTSKPVDPPAPARVDLSAFYKTITGKYEFAMLEQADNDILDMFYEGMSKISTEQRLIYICQMSMNTGEFGLVQVKDSKDVAAVKNIFQSRIDAQASGGAWYPQAVDNWANNSRVVSNGNYVMMVVHENCDAIVKEFNALF